MNRRQFIEEVTDLMQRAVAAVDGQFDAAEEAGALADRLGSMAFTGELSEEDQRELAQDIEEMQYDPAAAARARARDHSAVKKSAGNCEHNRKATLDSREVNIEQTYDDPHHAGRRHVCGITLLDDDQGVRLQLHGSGWDEGQSDSMQIRDQDEVRLADWAWRYLAPRSTPGHLYEKSAHELMREVLWWEQMADRATGPSSAVASHNFLRAARVVLVSRLEQQIRDMGPSTD